MSDIAIVPDRRIIICLHALLVHVCLCKGEWAGKPKL